LCLCLKWIHLDYIYSVYINIFILPYYLF